MFFPDKPALHQEYRRETSPQKWAMIQNDLGTAYLALGELVDGAEGIEYLHKAEAAFNEALKEYRRKTLPQDWAMAKCNLGLAYASLGGRTGGAEGIRYLKQAVTAYDLALEVFVDTTSNFHIHTQQDRQEALDLIAKHKAEL